MTNNPPISGIYKATINGNSFFAHYHPSYGWSTFEEPESWGKIKSELTVSEGKIMFVKY